MRWAIIVAFKEVIGEEQGRDKGNKDDYMESRQQTQLQYNALDLFDYGDAPPPSPSPISPHKASAPLQRNVEDDGFGGGNAIMGHVYKGQE